MGETSFISLDKKLREANEARSLGITYLGLTFFFLLFILDIIRWNQGLIQTKLSYKILFVIHFSFILYLLPLINKKYSFFKAKSKRLPLDSNAILTITVLHITQIPLAIMGSFTRGEMVSFAVFVCIINLIYESELKHKLNINIFIFLIMLVSIFIKDSDLPSKIVVLLECLAIMTPCYVLAKHQYNNRLASHKNEVLLYEQNLKLQKQNLIIEQKNEELKSFAYASSHDLKAPLRTIGNFTQLLKRKLNGSLDERGIEYMDFITNGVGNMSTMLDDLLEYATLDNNGNNEEYVKLNDIMLTVLNNLMNDISKSNASIEIKDNLPDLNISKTLAIQLFQNLISNSLKFKKEDTDPEIQIDYTTRGSDVVITVSDNGIGIPQESIPHAFGIFSRFHNAQKYEGHGIGLATCKKIVEKIDGDIWLESEEGKGTKFHVSFPLVNV